MTTCLRNLLLILECHRALSWGPCCLQYIYINNLSENVINAKVHLYADDTIIYCSVKSPAETILNLHKAFENIQLNLHALNLVLNDKKTKYM